MENLKIEKQARKESLIRFFNIVFGSIGAFILIFSIIALTFFRPENNLSPVINTITTVAEVGLGGVSLPVQNAHINMGPVKRTMIVYGLDNEGYGADAIMLVVLNRLDQTIKAINIPRDTLISMNGSRQIIRNHFGFAGRDNGPVLIKEHIEQMFNIDINYYIAVDLAAFRHIVDLLGPVYFDIPHRMFYNNFAVVSRGEVPLIIDLWPGYQPMDGLMAEQFVRFRTYHDGDLTRIRNQQEFMRAFLEQAVTSENIIRNAISIGRIVYDTVQTNLEFDSLQPFIAALPSFDLNNFHIYTLPVVFEPSGRLDIIMPEARTLVNYVFFSIPMPSHYNGEYNGEVGYDY